MRNNVLWFREIGPEMAKCRIGTEWRSFSVVLPLGKYHSTSTIASSRLRLAAVRGAVYPQSCRRDASLRAGGWQRQENLPERSERTIFGLDPAKSAAKPVRDREDVR